jgi:hypothetical protein
MMAETTTVRYPEATSEAPVIPGLAELLDEIARLHELDEDWDLDGSRRIDSEALLLANRVARLVAETAVQETRSWQPPEVGPVPDGSVALTWEGDHRETLMLFRPGQSATVECVTREKSAPPVRHEAPERQAVRLALWALGG